MIDHINSHFLPFKWPLQDQNAQTTVRSLTALHKWTIINMLIWHLTYEIIWGYTISSCGRDVTLSLSECERFSEISQLLFRCAGCARMWSRDIFANITHSPRIHSPCQYQPAGYHHTDGQMHWTCDSITWTVNIISISSCPCDAQHLTGFRWCGGQVRGRLPRLCVCVSACVGV